MQAGPQVVGGTIGIVVAGFSKGALRFVRRQACLGEALQAQPDAGLRVTLRAMSCLSPGQARLLSTVTEVNEYCARPAEPPGP